MAYLVWRHDKRCWLSHCHKSLSFLHLLIWTCRRTLTALTLPSAQPNATLVKTLVASIRSNNEPPIPTSRVLGLASSEQVQLVQCVEATCIGLADTDPRSSAGISRNGMGVPRNGYAPILCHSSTWTLICIAWAPSRILSDISDVRFPNTTQCAYLMIMVLI